jgi:HKD family nuclease
MAMPDTKFFTNTNDDTLVGRFQESLKYCQYFDVLVGYFRSSGFKQIADALNDTEKIRILVGLNADSETIAAVAGRHLE